MAAQAISRKSYLGAAVEAVALTPNATGPQLYIPTKSIMKAVQRREYLSEERATRDVNNDVILTTRDGSTSAKGSWYNDTFAFFLIGLLGHFTDSQPDATHVPTVYKHTFNLDDTPPTLTLYKSYHQVNYRAPGAATQKMQWKFNGKDKSLECDATLFHLFHTKYLTAMTPTFSTVKAFAGYKPTLTFSGGASSDIEEMTIDIEQKVDGWFPASGVPDFTRLDYGDRKASVEFTARFDTDTLYNLFLTGADDSLTIDFQGQLIANSGGTGTPPNQNYFQELSMTFGTIGYDSMEHDLGKDNVLIKAKATVRPTAGALLTGFIQNTVAAYTAG